jgi:transposase
MAELREVVRRLQLGHSIREVQRCTTVHRTIIRELKELSEKQGWLEADATIPDEEAILVARSGASRDLVSQHRLDAYRDDLKKWIDEGYTYVVIHVLIQARLKCSESTVRRYIHSRFPNKVKAVMRRATIAGEVMEVDFGYLGITYDKQTDRNRKTYIFSGRLRHSRRAWRECVFDQIQQTFFLCHIHAFENFGGVSERTVPDNLKAAVIHASFEEPIVNRAYRAMGEHYGFLIDPCPPYRPEQKGGVESDIKYVKGNFWPIFREQERERGYQTPRADELQQALEQWSEEVADERVIKGVGRTPREIFETEEAQKLKPLPRTRWDPLSWAEPKVAADWRVQFEKGFYSVPYGYIGSRVLVYGNSKTVRIYCGVTEIALHQRVSHPWEIRAKDEHAPPHLKEYLSSNRNGLLRWARQLAEPIGQLAEAIFADKAVDGMRPVRALIHLCDTYGADRLAAACRRALLYNTPQFRSVKEILKKGLDRLPLTQPAEPNGQLLFRFQREVGYFDPKRYLN